MSRDTYVSHETWVRRPLTTPEGPLRVVARRPLWAAQVSSRVNGSSGASGAVISQARRASFTVARVRMGCNWPGGHLEYQPLAQALEGG